MVAHRPPHHHTSIHSQHITVIVSCNYASGVSDLNNKYGHITLPAVDGAIADAPAKRSVV